MKKHNNLIKKSIYRDCMKAMLPSTIFYSVQEIIISSLSVYMAQILGEFADAIFNLNLSYGLNNIWKLLLGIGISVLFIPVIGLIGEVIMLHNSLKHDRFILERFFSKKYEKAMEIQEGEVQYRIENDPIELRCRWQDMVVKLFAIPFVLTYLLYNTLQISISFTIIVFCISVLKLVVPIVVKNVEAKYDLLMREYYSDRRVYEMQIVKNPSSIKLLGLTKYFIQKLDDIFKQNFKTIEVKYIKCKSFTKNISALFDTFSIILILIIGAVFVAFQKITPGSIAAMFGYFSVFGLMIQNVDYIIRSIPILRNISERLTLLYIDEESSTGKEIGTVTQISAEDLEFSYTNNEFIFRNINFDLQLPLKVAICGVNGSGKSTLLKIISGLLINYSGNFKINNIEQKEISIESWRNKIAFVEQEPFLFAGSTIDNIRIGDLSAGNEKVYKVIDELGISYLLNRDAISENNGLSGGEKQKISIARALLKNTPILILDEPNNHLDKDSLQWLGNFIKHSDKTIVFVSHNDNLSKYADTIITLDKL